MEGGARREFRCSGAFRGSRHDGAGEVWLRAQQGSLAGVAAVAVAASAVLGVG